MLVEQINYLLYTKEYDKAVVFFRSLTVPQRFDVINNLTDEGINDMMTNVHKCCECPFRGTVCDSIDTPRCVEWASNSCEHCQYNECCHARCEDD